MAAKKKVVMDYVGDPPREFKEKEDFYGFELDEHQLKFANAIWNPGIDIVFKNYIEHFGGQERTAFCNLVNNYRSWISRHADELE